ncbi:MAG: hypothetical protein E7063_02260 [Spirochaetaceae bacterium]|nr:hypothetical protein [Spirochaetaceae bacterium]
MDEKDGSVNMEAYCTWYEYMNETYASIPFSDELGFYQVNKYENGGWYIPAKNELLTIHQDEKIASVLSENGWELTTGLIYWTSTFVPTDTTYKKAYAYSISNSVFEEYNVGQTMCWVRPVMKIIL